MSGPLLEPRGYQELLNDALARVAVHNPEWTNLSHADPGVTLLELFAFMHESIGYRANQVPQRNFEKFIELLGVPRSPGAASRGIVTIANDHGEPKRIPVNSGLEVRAGAVAFRTEMGLDVLPVKAQAYAKRAIVASQRLLDYHRQLYAAVEGTTRTSDLRLYEVVPLDPGDPSGIDLGATADGALWLALTLRDREPVEQLEATQRELAGTTLSIGLCPVLDSPILGETLGVTPAAGLLEFAVPNLALGSATDPRFTTLDATWSTDVLTEPGVVQVRLPPGGVGTWTDLDPLEDGVGGLPPTLADTTLDGRVVTWVRITAARGAAAKLMWAAANAVPVTQRGHVIGEALSAGTGEPDQSAPLAHAMVLADTVRVSVSAGGQVATWAAIDDLLAAGPEVPSPDPTAPPGRTTPPQGPSQVFAVDEATGTVRFGDGARGARPARGAVLRATYDYASGAKGNVGPGAIADAPALPSGLKVTNPLRTWGGSDRESTDAAAKQASRFLGNHDRLVTQEDFETITWRAPGIDLGRVDVLTAFVPSLVPSAPGDAPGAVTVVVVPASDAEHPSAPQPDRLFLDTVCRHLEPRRLVTTEVHVIGPTYVPVWVSVGYVIEPRAQAVDVREALTAELARFLAPLDPTAPPWWAQPPVEADAPFVHISRGWPLGQPVLRLELMARANRVPGVRMVSDLLLARGSDGASESVAMGPLELPQVMRIAAAEGDPPGLDQLRGGTPSDAPHVLPVPKVPESC